MPRANSLEKTLMLGKIEGRRRRGQQRMRWLDGIIGPMDMSWADSGRWWRAGKPDVLQSMGSQSIGHSLVTEQQQSARYWIFWTFLSFLFSLILEWISWKFLWLIFWPYNWFFCSSWHHIYFPSVFSFSVVTFSNNSGFVLQNKQTTKQFSNNSKYTNLRS